MERTDTTLLNLNSRIKSSRQTARRSTTRYSSSLAPGTETTPVKISATETNAHRSPIVSVSFCLTYALMSPKRNNTPAAVRKIRRIKITFIY